MANVMNKRSVQTEREIRMTKPLFAIIVLLGLNSIGLAQAPPTDSLRTTKVADDTPVAIIDGEIVRMRDLEAYSKAQDPKKLWQLNQQVYEFRLKMLDTMLGERLLVMAAKDAQLTVDELLTKNLTIEPVTEEAIEAVYNDAPNASRLDLITSRPLIRKFLEDQRLATARANYIERLKTQYRAGRRIGIHLEPPRQLVAVNKSDPTKGSGKIQIIEFSDFECPYCRQVQPVLRELLARFDGRVTLVWKDYPLPNHSFAVPAAAAARCAGDQGKFWEYHDALYANQQSLGPTELKKHAAALGLDSATFNQCLDGGKYRKQAQGALQAAASYAVPATPTVFINGRMVRGVASLDTYARIVEEELDGN